MMQFGLTSYMTWNFLSHSNKPRLQEATAELRYWSGPSFVYKAIAYANKRLFSGVWNPQSREFNPSVSQIMVVVSTGQFALLDPENPAAEFKESGGTIVAVGIGPNADLEGLRNIASPGFNFVVSDESEISSVVQAVVEGFTGCGSTNTTTTAPTLTTTTAGQTTQTTTRNPMVTTTSVSSVTTSSYCAVPKLDVAFVLDASQSFTQARFEQDVLPLVADMEAALNVGPGQTHVALVEFSSLPLWKWNFLQYTSVAELQTPTLNVPYLNGPSVLSKAIEYTDKKVFSPIWNYQSRSNQADVSDVMVIITTGEYAVEDPIPAANAFKASGGIVVAIGIGPDVVQSVVDQLASPGFAFFADFSELSDLVEHVKNSFLPDSCFSTTTTTVAPTTTSNTSETCIYDVGLVVDSSGSVSTDTFDSIVVPTLVELEGSLNVSVELTRVAAVQFTTEVTEKWNFLSYTDVSTLQAVTSQQIKPLGGTSDIGKAIRLSDSDLFNVLKNSQSRSRNPNVYDVMVLVSAGKTTNKEGAVEQADAFKSTGRILVSIGVGDSIDSSFLEDLASPGYSYVVQSVADISAVVNSISSQLLTPACFPSRTSTPSTGSTTTTSTASATGRYSCNNNSCDKYDQLYVHLAYDGLRYIAGLR
eukprot:GHVQ01041067.1.p1 GENE.GHVQ01041067.1~~GHVQ01041067.1.p1  ORF type:complete len:644 (-),score=89.26 GHVQ01041067.1:1360-3291(-)